MVLEDTTVDTDLATTASVRPRLSPRLLLIPTFTVTAAMGWDTDTEDPYLYGYGGYGL